MGKVKKFFKTLIYSVLFFVLALVGFIVLMFINEGEKIDRTGLDRVFVKQSLNVRAGAGTDFDILETLSAGDKFYVADTLDNGWLKMILGSEDASFSAEDETYAFVSSNYVYPLNEFDSWHEDYEREQQRLRAERQRQREIESEKRRYKIDSYTICQDFVKNRLRSPSTADFPSFRNVNVFETGNNKYMVKGYVDAQNSFGATLRTQYECEVQLDGETWRLQHIELME